jgi:hypothetical protein
MDSKTDMFTDPAAGPADDSRQLSSGLHSGLEPNGSNLRAPSSASQNVQESPNGRVAGDESDEEFERKWVGVAKGIVARTKHDPRAESEQLNKAAKAYREQIKSRGFNMGAE